MLPELTNVTSTPDAVGGQKQVFAATLGGANVAIKVMQVFRDNGNHVVDGDATTVLIPDDDDEASSEEEPIDQEPIDLKRLKREVGILARLNTPYVVRLVPLRGEPCLSLRNLGNRYVVFAEEWIDGKDLRTLFKKPQEPWLPVDVLRLAHDVTAGIKALWEEEVVHRDLSPGNIMRRQDGSYVILDLGLALDLNADAITGTHRARTPWYHAPEILVPASRGLLDQRTDLFTLGIVLFQALTGAHPIKKSGMGSMDHTKAEHQMSRGDIQRELIPPNTPDKLKDLILAMLERDMTLRPRTCQRVLDDLATMTPNPGSTR